MNSIINSVKAIFWLDLVLGIIFVIGAIITDINYGFAAIVLINAMAFYSIYMRLLKLNQKKEN